MAEDYTLATATQAAAFEDPAAHRAFDWLRTEMGLRKHGTITIRIQDGRPVFLQVDRTEKAEDGSVKRTHVSEDLRGAREQPAAGNPNE